MKKLFLTLVSSFFAVSCFAANLSCPPATDTNSSTFCSTFKTSATCHCTDAGYPPGICQNLELLYNAMLARFGTLQAACNYQKDTPAQVCIDDWNCYRIGGRDSKGRLCSSTGKHC